VIPPSSVFDVKNAQVAVLPKPTNVKTYQAGNLCGSTTASPSTSMATTATSRIRTSPRTDAQTGEPIYYLTSPSNTKGVEAESTSRSGGGVGLYLTVHSAAPSMRPHLWVATARVTPNRWRKHTSTQLGPRLLQQTYRRMYNDNGAKNQAVRDRSLQHHQPCS